MPVLPIGGRLIGVTFLSIGAPLEQEAQGIAREILLIAGLVAVVLCLGLVAVSLLLP
jgi:hypothetical protein